MITKYDEFIVEKMILSINESIIEYSEKFTELLKKIDSPIAQALLSAHKKDRDVVNNYFDIDTKDTITFVSDKKAQQLANQPSEYFTLKVRDIAGRWTDNGIFLNIIRIEKDLRDILEKSYENVDEILKTKFNYIPQIDEVGKLVSQFVSQGGSIWVGTANQFVLLKFGDKFVVTKQENITPKEAAWVKNRQPIRIGRGIKALTKTLGFDFSDSEIEDFVNKWKSSFDWINNAYRNFEQVRGEEIADWYYYATYEQGLGKGTLSSSCMARKPSDYFEIYTNNPEDVSLLILKSEININEIVGRALVWELQSGETFMDRVYSHDDDKVILFRQYAKSKGWYYKADNDSDSDSKVVSPTGESKYMELTVLIKDMSYRKYPYMDTLKYLTEGRDYWKLSNSYEGSEWRLESVTGGRESMRCESCGGSGTIFCENCDGDGEVSSSCTECYRGKINCEKCDGEGCTYDEDDNEISCSECSGNGKVTCQACDGEGTITEECYRCAGRGEYPCYNCN